MIINSPLEQFGITSILEIEIGYLSISVTNATIYVVISSVCMYIIYSMSIYKARIIPNNWQLGIEKVYVFVERTIKQSLSEKEEGSKYFPVMFYIFSFILFANLVGMVPYSFCITSHICITLTLGIIIWIGTTMIGLRKHGLHFFSLFMPSGAPFGIMPFLIGIELLSFLFKGISISVRLFANMMAGHSLLKILAGFAWTMLSAGKIGILGAGMVLSVVVIISGLELGIAFLQAYVFTMLSCMYLNDCIALH
jgi:ATP synthase subunit 6